ncbi:MAG: IS1595 family transposase, partial [Prevotella sp.]|nr:IS1595 family transposase [Prevotella sp.]
FCYKFNRRYFGENLFDRLVMISANYQSNFEHRTYRNVA